ncbi:MAG: DNA-binding protein WhiA [Actinobacteria bacterium]|nr:DNA-binding protein WhiA [Actinomycetota bacterium]
MTESVGEGRRAGTSFTDRVRQELARIEPERACDQLAELAALLRLAGGLHLRGGDAGNSVALEVETTSGAVARRVYALLQRYEVDTELRVRQPGGVRRRSTYVVAVTTGARAVATATGLLDGDGRPGHDVSETLLRGECDRRAYARGALLAAASFSTPGRAPHLEIAVRDAAVAQRIAGLLTDLTAGNATVNRTRRGHRVVLKSTEAIAHLLAATGAGDAYLAWEEHRLRRQLRAEATRLANADAANLQRAVAAASTQLRDVERAVAVLGWQGMSDGLRQVALARLANPSASLSELGELCDPPVDKSSVLRRLRRLSELADEAGSGVTEA